MDVGRHRFKSREAHQGDNLTQSVELDDSGYAIASAGPPPDVIRKTTSVKVRINSHSVAETLGCGEQRFQFHLLDWLLTDASALGLVNGGQHLIICKGREFFRDLRLLLQKSEINRAVDDLQVVPQFLDRCLDASSSVGERQHAHHLGKVRVRGGTDQEPTRLIAGLIRISAKPRPGAATRTQRTEFQDGRLVHPARFLTLAAHHEIRQIATRAPFVEPQLTAAIVVGSVNESPPIEIVDVAFGAGANETGRDNGPTIEPPFVIETPAVHQATGSLPAIDTGFLDDEPLRKPPRTDALGRLARIIRVWRRRI